MNLTLRSLAVALGIVVFVPGCFRTNPAPTVFGGCWEDGAPTDYIIRTAANSIIGDRGAGGPRIRALANVPLQVDSIRAHSRLVTDAAICLRLWRALDPDDRLACIAVVQIGRTYWVRLPYGYRAFDDSNRLLTAITDL